MLRNSRGVTAPSRIRPRPHFHRWLIDKYGVRAYEDGRRQTVIFATCTICGSKRSKAIARRELTPGEVNAFALKRYEHDPGFTGQRSERPGVR